MIFWIRKDFRNKKKAYILKIGANSFGEVTSFWTQIAADWMDFRHFSRTDDTRRHGFTQTSFSITENAKHTEWATWRLLFLGANRFVPKMVKA